jgi:hypothetical protein
MTDAKAHYKPLSITANTKHLSIQLMYHNLFRYLKPCRKRYNMTVNELLVLNGIYIYTVIRKTEFTINAAYSFLGYFNKPRLKWYFSQLIKYDLIYYHTTVGNHVYYRLSEKGYVVIGELFEGFEIVQQKFLQKWNVSI